MPLGSVDGFEQTIRKLWLAPEQIAVIGKNARIDYESKYMPEDNYRQLEEIYIDLIKEK